MSCCDARTGRPIRSFTTPSRFFESLGGLGPRGTPTGDGLEARELWTSLDMKPDYNDLLVHDGNIHGFDNAIFACIGLADGEPKWKGGGMPRGRRCRSPIPG